MIDTRHFQGETMQCCMCDRSEVARENLAEDWRCIDADNARFYVCAKHFPAGDSTSKHWRRAYELVLRRIRELSIEQRMIPSLLAQWRPQLAQFFAAIRRESPGETPAAVKDVLMRRLGPTLEDLIAEFGADDAESAKRIITAAMSKTVDRLIDEELVQTRVHPIGQGATVTGYGGPAASALERMRADNPGQQLVLMMPRLVNVPESPGPEARQVDCPTCGEPCWWRPMPPGFGALCSECALRAAARG
jgi:hypothetical protein